MDYCSRELCVFGQTSIRISSLCSFLSTLQLKCHQYWPKDEGYSMLFGSLRVTMKRQTSLAFWKERIIHITHNEVGQTDISFPKSAAILHVRGTVRMAKCLFKNILN